MHTLFGQDKYDFSKAIYTGARKPLEVVCKEHGSFYPMPTNLLKGRGCSKCGKIKGGLKIRKDNSFFIIKAKEVHGDRYDYSKVNYTGNDKPVEIICSEHGSFLQVPSSHYSGSGCPRCIRRTFDTLSEVWESIDETLTSSWKLISSHDNVNFKITDKVKIFCTKHNEFFNSNIYALLKRRSCCNLTLKSLISDGQKKDSSSYRRHILEAHGNTYEYPNYPNGLVGVYDKIDILCKHHGVFEQTLYHHISRKQGCPECSNRTRGLYKTEKWLTKATDKILKELKLDDSCAFVSNCNVKGSKDHFTFNCKEHGNFGKSFGNFMQGQRCPDCNVFEGWGKKSYIERGKAFYEGKSNIYLIRVYNENESFYKVGITFHHDLKKRFTKHEMPYRYEKIMTINADVEEIVDFEMNVHKTNKPYHYAPEVKFGGSVRECFTKEGLDSTVKLFNKFKEKINV